jgi:hypothetical protein
MRQATDSTYQMTQNHMMGHTSESELFISLYQTENFDEEENLYQVWVTEEIEICRANQGMRCMMYIVH